MDFGKPTDPATIDFSFPAEPARNSQLLASLSPRLGPPDLYLGPTGYSMKPWVGKWYPAGAKEQDFLVHYGRQFNTIEFNATHYRIPDEGTVMRWYEDTPADFRFCPKVPQSISHSTDLGLSTPDLAVFCQAIQGLQEKLGCCFLQLPPYFSTDSLPLLERFLEDWPPEISLAVEVRHESFFEKTAAAEDYFRLLRNFDTATVITDVAGRRDVLHLRLTNARVLVRFVGYGLHPTDYTRIQAWAGQLKAWVDAGLHEVFFFTHEPDNLLAPELCAFAVEAFAAAIPGAQVRGPHPVAAPAVQGSLF